MSTTDTTNTDFTIRLHDGRNIGIATVGKSDGVPIIHCHGSGSSRLETKLFASQALAQGVRLIGLDRPGIGRSDPKMDYRLLDWPDDVAEVADKLGLKQFAIEGVSAGGPYALACAYKIPHRLTDCGLISTVSPPLFLRKAGSLSMRIICLIGTLSPWFIRTYARLILRAMGSDETDIEKYFVRYGKQLGAADQKILADPETRRLLVQALAESARQGRVANVEEAIRGMKPWGFQVKQITFKQLFVWHGEQDRIMPIAPVRLLVQALPHCAATFYPDEGHFSTLANHANEIFHVLSTQPSQIEQ